MTSARALLACLALATTEANAEPVDVELVLAVDVSESMDRDEFCRPARRLCPALRDPAFIRAALSTTHKAPSILPLSSRGRSFIVFCGTRSQVRWRQLRKIDRVLSRGTGNAGRLAWFTNVWRTISGLSS